MSASLAAPTSPLTVSTLHDNDNDDDDADAAGLLPEPSHCVHFQDYYREHGLEVFNTVHAFFSASFSTEARKMKALSCLCYACGSSGPQLYSCLHCIYFGCRGEHIAQHMHAYQHHIALELTHGVLYCWECDDHVYHPDVHDMADVHLRREAR